VSASIESRERERGLESEERERAPALSPVVGVDEPGASRRERVGERERGD
jgi:hypothetical protein